VKPAGKDFIQGKISFYDVWLHNKTKIPLYLQNTEALES